MKIFNPPFVYQHHEFFAPLGSHREQHIHQSVTFGEHDIRKLLLDIFDKQFNHLIDNAEGVEQAGWRTLSTNEWQYLFNTSGRMVNGKPCNSNAVSGVSIGGTTYKGVFIYPDNYNGDEVSDSMTWEQINAAGIVFLPAAGFRFDSNVNNVGDSGYYWSSTEYADDRDNAYRVYLDSRSIHPGSIANRGYGFSVRLITECQ